MATTQLICCSLVLLSVANGITHSQSSRTGTYTVLVTPQASLVPIGTEALAAGGASVAEKGLATAAFTNPASMQFTGITAYAEFGKYATSKWAADFEYNGQFVAPSFVSLGMQLGDVSLGVSYFRQYSNHLSSEPIPITTPSFPEGTGEFVRAERSVELHSFCGSASIALIDNVSLGLTLGGNYFKHNEEILNVSVRGTDAGLFIIGGANVTLDENVTMGASVRYNWSMEFVPVTNPPLRNMTFDTTGQIRTSPVVNPPAEARFPPIFETGISYQVLPQLKLLASAEFQNWTSALRDGENRWQVHFGGVIDANENIALRFGFFTLSNPTEYSKEILNQQFVTFGLQVKLEPIAISLAVMDSHLFKKSMPSGGAWPYTEPFYQTYFSSGVSATF